ATGSAITCPRRVESERETTCSPSAGTPPASTPATIRRFISTAAPSSRARVLVSTKQAEPGSESTATGICGSWSKATGMPSTHCDPVGSSSRTSRRRAAVTVAGTFFRGTRGGGRLRAGAHVRTGPHPVRCGSCRDDEQDRGQREADERDRGAHDGPGLERGHVVEAAELADQPEAGVVHVRPADGGGA